MATQQIKINENQEAALSQIISEGKVIADDFDKRTIGALETRGLVKVTENKKGVFVAPTAKGKKFIN